MGIVTVNSTKVENSFDLEETIHASRILIRNAISVAIETVLKLIISAIRICLSENRSW